MYGLIQTFSLSILDKQKNDHLNIIFTNKNLHFTIYFNQFALI